MPKAIKNLSFKSKINKGIKNYTVTIPKSILSKIGINNMAHCVVIGNSIQISAKENIVVPALDISDFVSH